MDDVEKGVEILKKKLSVAGHKNEKN